MDLARRLFTFLVTLYMSWTSSFLPFLLFSDCKVRMKTLASFISRIELSFLTFLNLYICFRVGKLVWTFRKLWKREYMCILSKGSHFPLASASFSHMLILSENWRHCCSPHRNVIIIFPKAIRMQALNSSVLWWKYSSESRECVKVPRPPLYWFWVSEILFGIPLFWSGMCLCLRLSSQVCFQTTVMTLRGWYSYICSAIHILLEDLEVVILHKIPHRSRGGGGRREETESMCVCVYWNWV